MRLEGRDPVGESFIHANGGNKEGFTDYRDALEVELMGFLPSIDGICGCLVRCGIKV